MSCRVSDEEDGLSRCVLVACCWGVGLFGKFRPGVRKVPKLSLRGRGVATPGDVRAAGEPLVGETPAPLIKLLPGVSPKPVTGAPLTVMPGISVAAVAAAATDKRRPIRLA